MIFAGVGVFIAGFEGGTRPAALSVRSRELSDIARPHLLHATLAHCVNDVTHHRGAGVGPLFFVVVSEVFPQPVRGQAMGAAYVIRLPHISRSRAARVDRWWRGCSMWQ